MEELTTIDTILEWLETAVKENKPIDSHTWVRAGMKINTLLGDEHKKLFDLQQEVAQLKVLRIESGDTVTKAKLMVEATNEYKEFCIQKARIGRLTELIRLAKVQSKLSDNEMKGY